MTRSTIRLSLKTLVLFSIWLVISGKYNPFHMSLGFMASLGVAWLNSGYVRDSFQPVPWLRIMRYFPWLFIRIVQSSLHLAKLILHPALPIDPGLIRYHTKLQGEAAIVLLGNSITLTPGTITAEVKGQELVVHTMDEISGRDLVSRKLEHQLAGVFGQREAAE